MIVKNEASVIRRCLDSVRPIIDHWVIVDTGSTDGTQDIIREHLDALPGTLFERPWQDFAHNRSEALALARSEADYSLIIDADDMLQVPGGFQVPELTADCYVIDIEDPPMRYQRTQLVRNTLPWRYQGVLHEYLTCEGSGPPGHFPVVMRRNHDGARRRDPETYRKDAAVLEEALRTETEPFLISRYRFYLAQSYRDCGDRENALHNYLARAELGGWAEEVYVSLYLAAQMKDALGHPEQEVIDTYLRASDLVPGRVEALHGASRYCRFKSRNEEGYQIAKRGLDVPIPGDALFVEPWIYEFGLLDEYAVNAYWSGHHRECLNASLKILATGKLSGGEMQRVVSNARASAELVAPEQRAPNLGSLGEEGFVEQHALVAPRNLRSRIIGLPRVLVAILAKQKEPSLPLYLECIEALDYPKSSIVLYIRTNNNTDRTEQILRDWVTRVGHLYAHVEFDAEDVADRVEQFGVHEWNPTRFRVLGHIRNVSLQRALDHDCAFYFVADVDNFVRPCTLRELVALDLPIVAPFLRSVSSVSFYSNYHADTEPRGYYQDCDQYQWVLNRWVRGVIEMPVVHCTYLIRADVLPQLRYDDATDRHEYVIFSDIARNADIPQYFDNRQIYGYVTFEQSGDQHVAGGIERAGALLADDLSVANASAAASLQSRSSALKKAGAAPQAPLSRPEDCQSVACDPIVSERADQACWLEHPDYDVDTLTVATSLQQERQTPDPFVNHTHSTLGETGVAPDVLKTSPNPERPLIFQTPTLQATNAAAQGYPASEVISLYLAAADASQFSVMPYYEASRLCRDHGRYREGLELAKRGIAASGADGLLAEEDWLRAWGLYSEGALNAAKAEEHRDCAKLAIAALQISSMPSATRNELLALAQQSLEHIAPDTNFAHDSLFAPDFVESHTIRDDRDIGTLLPDPPPTVLIAILAKQKETCLPLYLECIERLDYPKSAISLYIRTNNNTDRTADILRAWIGRVGHAYRHVEFDEQDVEANVQQFNVHEWNTTRFRVLGHIRNVSLQKTIELECDYYFVVDVDCFIISSTLRELIALNLPMAAPFLRNFQERIFDTNFFAAVDDNGYYKDDRRVFPTLTRSIRGIVEVPLIHCVYLLRRDTIPFLTYLDDSDRYEFVTFADSARRHHIPQYIDNRKIYGYITGDDHLAAAARNAGEAFVSQADKARTIFEAVWDKAGSQPNHPLGTGIRALRVSIPDPAVARSRLPIPNPDELRQFSAIYDHKAWGEGSGWGSHPINSVDYVRFISNFIKLNRVRSVIEIGCGDWQFSRFIDYGGASYVGYDIVESVVVDNRTRFAAQGISFELLTTETIFEPADLLICKDVLQHLPNALVVHYLQAFRGMARMCLITNDGIPEDDVNIDILTTNCRPIRLDCPPFQTAASVVFTWDLVWDLNPRGSRKFVWLMQGMV
jgi:glycosyltransferase involved in cell wall biosynthesis